MNPHRYLTLKEYFLSQGLTQKAAHDKALRVVSEEAAWEDLDKKPKRGKKNESTKIS